MNFCDKGFKSEIDPPKHLPTHHARHISRDTCSQDNLKITASFLCTFLISSLLNPLSVLSSEITSDPKLTAAFYRQGLSTRQFGHYLHHISRDFLIQDFSIMLRSFNACMPKHLAYTFNGHTIPKCNSSSKSMPRRVRS